MHHRVEGLKRQRAAAAEERQEDALARRRRRFERTAASDAHREVSDAVMEPRPPETKRSVRSALLFDSNSDHEHEPPSDDGIDLSDIFDPTEELEAELEPLMEVDDADEEPPTPHHRAAASAPRVGTVASSMLRDRWREAVPPQHVVPPSARTIDIDEELDAARRLIGAHRDVSDMDYEEILALQDLCGVVSRGLSKRRIEKWTTTLSTESTALWIDEQQLMASRNHVVGDVGSVRGPHHRSHHHRTTTTTTVGPPTAPHCTVCLEAIVAPRNNTHDGSCRRIDACGHVFHSECIVQWLQREKVCPVCRREVSAPSTSE